MKNKWIALIVSLLLMLAFAAPVAAYTDYGLAYDVTDQMEPAYMETLADQTLQGILDRYGFEARVDIVDDLEGNPIEEYAELFRGRYGYGKDGNGVLLMILVYTDDNGLSFGDYVVYPYGTGKEYFDEAALTELDASLKLYLSAEGFADELYRDQTAMETACNIYAGYVETVLTENGVAPAEGSTEAATPVVTAEEAESVENPDYSGFTAVPGEAPDVCIEDHYLGILSDDELAELEELAQAASAKYGCGIYFTVVEDFTTSETARDTINEAAAADFELYELGLGEERDGVELYVSLADRSYALVVNGSSANYAFSPYAQELLVKSFTGPMSEDDWYTGIHNYITTAEEFIALAVAGTPVTEDGSDDGGSILVKVAVCVGVPLVIALIVCLIFRGQMKGVRKQTAARDYMTGQVYYNSRSRVYSHTTETRVPLPKVDKDGDGPVSGKF